MEETALTYQIEADHALAQQLRNACEWSRGDGVPVTFQLVLPDGEGIIRRYRVEASEQKGGVVDSSPFDANQDIRDTLAQRLDSLIAEARENGRSAVQFLQTTEPDSADVFTLSVEGPRPRSSDTYSKEDEHQTSSIFRDDQWPEEERR